MTERTTAQVRVGQGQDDLDPGRLRVAADAFKTGWFPGEDGDGEWTNAEREEIAGIAIRAYHADGDCPTCKRAVAPLVKEAPE